MTDTTADDVAETLAARHRRLDRFTLEMPQGREADVEFAYAVQAKPLPRIAAGGIDRAGYKIGATTPRLQEMCGIPEPVAGVVFRERLLQSPARVEARSYARIGIESELAVRIGTTVPLDPKLLESDAFFDHFDAATAAFEIVDDSDADYKRLTGAKLIADNGWNAGLVLSTPRAIKGARTLAAFNGILFRNGQEIDRGTSSDVLGDPFNALRWLCKHLARTGTQLEAGQWVTTGSHIPTQFAVAGETYRYEIEGFTPVELAVA